MPKITPFLWFDSQAEEAAKYYVSIFSAGNKKESKIVTTTRYTGDGANAAHRPEGSVMTVVFRLDGQEFVAINGGPVFKFTEAVSFVVNCDSQKEVDYFWEKLSEGGDPKAQQCGWLKDKYGLSWQIVPKNIEKLLSDPDREKAARVMKAVLRMKKLDLEELEEVAESV